METVYRSAAKSETKYIGNFSKHEEPGSSDRIVNIIAIGMQAALVADFFAIFPEHIKLEQNFRSAFPWRPRRKKKTGGHKASALRIRS